MGQGSGAAVMVTGWENEHGGNIEVRKGLDHFLFLLSCR